MPSQPSDPFAQGKITPQQYAQWYRQAHPEYSQYFANKSDDYIVQQVLKNNPDLAQHLVGGSTGMTGTAKIGGPATGEAARSEKGYDIANWLAELPSTITSMMGAGLMAPTGTGGMISGAAAGSFPGSLIEIGLKRMLFPPSKGWDPVTADKAAKVIMKNMALNTGFEALGAGARYLPGKLPLFPSPRSLRISAEALNLPENAAIRETSREYGLGLTYPQIAPTPRNIVRFSMFPRSMAGPKQMMEAGDEAIRARSEQAVGGLAERAFGPQAVSSTRDVSGKIVKDVIEQGGEPLFKEQSDRLVNIFNLQAQGMRAKPGAINKMRKDLQDEIARRADWQQQLSRIPGEKGGELLTPQARTSKIYRDILALPDNVNIIALNEERKKLLQETRTASSPVAGEAPGQAKFFVHKLTEVIDEALKGTPAERSWKNYRGFYDAGVDIFNSREIINATTEHPEEFTKWVGPTNITGAKNMRSAIVGYASAYGSPQQKAAAMGAWNRFRAQWVNENILAGDITGLTSRIKAIDPEVMRTIMHDPEGKTLVRNATRLGAAFDRVTRVAGKGADQNLRYIIYRVAYHAAIGASILAGSVVGHPNMSIGLAATAGAALGTASAALYGKALARILYSPELTERVMQLTTWLARNPWITTANFARIVDRALVEAPWGPLPPKRPGRTQPAAAPSAPSKPSAAVSPSRSTPLPPGSLDQPPIEQNFIWPPPQPEEQPQ